MKSLAVGATVIALCTIPAQAGPYAGLAYSANSISLNGPVRGIIPDSLTGYSVNGGWQFGRISIGAEYSSASGSVAAGSLSSIRYSGQMAYHFPILRVIDGWLAAGLGRSSYRATSTAFTAGSTVTAPFFSGSETDWNVGVGTFLPLYGPIKLRLEGRYQPTDFGGRANSGLLFNFGIAIKV